MKRLIQMLVPYDFEDKKKFQKITTSYGTWFCTYDQYTSCAFLLLSNPQYNKQSALRLKVALENLVTSVPKYFDEQNDLKSRLGFQPKDLMISYDLDENFNHEMNQTQNSIMSMNVKIHNDIPQNLLENEHLAVKDKRDPQVMNLINEQQRMKYQKRNSYIMNQQQQQLMINNNGIVQNQNNGIYNGQQQNNQTNLNQQQNFGNNANNTSINNNNQKNNQLNHDNYIANGNNSHSNNSLSQKNNLMNNQPQNNNIYHNSNANIQSNNLNTQLNENSQIISDQNLQNKQNSIIHNEENTGRQFQQDNNLINSNNQYFQDEQSVKSQQMQYQQNQQQSTDLNINQQISIQNQSSICSKYGTYIGIISGIMGLISILLVLYLFIMKK